MREPVGLRVRLSSRPESVAIVRAALSGLEDAGVFSGELAADVKTAVSEACNNVTLHAYPADAPGPMFVEILAFQDCLEARVRDTGRGITRITSRSDRLGLGLAVINSLTDRSQFRTPPGGGTEVRLCFETPTGLSAAEPRPEGQGVDSDPAQPDVPDMDAIAELLDGEVQVVCWPAEIERRVLTRMLIFIAASSHFTAASVEGLNATGEALARQILPRSDEWIGAGIDAATRRLSVSVGPLRHLGSPETELTRSIDVIEAHPLDGRGVLRFTIADPRDPV